MKTKQQARKINIETTLTTNNNDDDGLMSGPDILVSGDHVWFYAPIDQTSAVRLNAILQEMSMKLAPTAFSSMHEVASPSPIWLHINSGGGEVFSAFAMADTIYRISATVPIITIVEGCCASGATFMSIAGSKRLMRKNSFMLIHELSSGFWGRHSEMVDEVENNERIMESIRGWYKEHTKIPKKEMEKILKKDIWWNAETCLKYGLIDQII